MPSLEFERVCNLVQNRLIALYDHDLLSGFAIFNDFGTTIPTSDSPALFGFTNQPQHQQLASTTFKPEMTTLNFPSQQPQLSNGVTFANLLKRARLRTSEDNAYTTTPLSYTEEGKIY